MKKLLALALILGLVLSVGLAQAAPSQGETLVRELWSLMAAKDVAKIEAMTSPAFQSLHSFGAYDKAREMRLLANLNLGPYTLSDFRESEQGPMIVVTYKVSVAETIDGERLNPKPAQRLSIFLNTERGWQWLAHANLKPVK